MADSVLQSYSNQGEYREKWMAEIWGNQNH